MLLDVLVSVRLRNNDISGLFARVLKLKFQNEFTAGNVVCFDFIDGELEGQEGKKPGIKLKHCTRSVVHLKYFI